MKKVITYGTFDKFHIGHYNILKRAKELGDYLIVGVSGESYDIERGKLNVQDSLLTRIKNVEDTGFADQIIIEEYNGQKINDIRKYGVDVFVVGSDWRGKFDYIGEYCKLVYLERTKNISSTQIREQNARHYNIGIATDNASDNGVVSECLYVSGAHAKSVYSADDSVLDVMRGEFELDSFFNDYDKFLDNIDIVYIKSDISGRTQLVERAVRAGKHVISVPPITTDMETLRRIFALAKDKNVIVTEQITLAYLRAFTQLIWLLHGGIIGEITNVRIVMGQSDFESDDFTYLKETALYAALKIVNETGIAKHWTTEIIKEKGKCGLIVLSYPKNVVSIELSSVSDLDNGIKIFGTNGYVQVPDDWWNIGYFQVKTPDDTHPKHYSFNYEGNGFRYLLHDLLISIEMGRKETTKLPFVDMGNVVAALNNV